ncbi:MAG TPA: DNA repair protein RadA [Dehalococcoidia bacterium]|nr:DNA repair protein RadA [Dehalococcoidia bacterium]
MVERAKPRSLFVCQECGQESLRWQGRCPECQAWNSFSERSAKRAPPAHTSMGPDGAAPVEIATMRADEFQRFPLDDSEFDRVLGCGVVPGSVILMGGDPGIGKSTLVLQVAEHVCTTGRTVLYLSGEESAHQLKLRAQRLGATGRGLFLLSETNLDEGLRTAERLSPALVVVDSIQTVFSPELPNQAGSVAQLRVCTTMLMQWAKETNVPVIIVGHVTKEGEIAGPRLLEHIVDVVLYLEGERFSSYRLLRGVKNRFGAVSEVGVFEMLSTGLQPVENPSEIFLAERASGAVGSIIAPTIEGSRPLLVEIQALTSPSPLSMPRRMAQGIDQSRLLLITAVLSKRTGMALGSQDVMVNVVGGLRLQEPAVDLPAALAIASSFRDVPLPADMVAFGEIGLSGELRSCSHIERRLGEAAKLGFRRCMLPACGMQRGDPRSEMMLIPAGTLTEAMHLALGRAPAPSHPN